MAIKAKESASEKFLRRLKQAIALCFGLLGGLILFVKGFGYFDGMIKSLGPGLWTDIFQFLNGAIFLMVAGISVSYFFDLFPDEKDKSQPKVTIQSKVIVSHKNVDAASLEAKIEGLKREVDLFKWFVGVVLAAAVTIYVRK